MLHILASALFVTALVMAALGASTVRAQAGGPIILMGIDAEDFPFSHGDASVYAGVINDGILTNVTNGGSGILGIGCGKAVGDEVTVWWNAVTALTPEMLTCVNGAAAIAAVDFTGFAMIGVASDVIETPFGGLTQAELDALNARDTDIADFVNSGGGLFGLSNCGLNDPYGYLGGVGGFTCGLVFEQDVEPTAAGAALGITSTNLDVCCWHDSYTVFPAFLEVLAFYPQLAGNPAAAIGGQQVIITFGITLSPDHEVNPAGSDHTVVATVEDSLGNPLVGVVVEFEVVSGPNAGANGMDVTDANGEATFTYTSNGLVGTDEIVASFTGRDGTVRFSNRVTKEWVDSTAPAVACRPTVNPAGGNVPAAPGRGGQGQNQDGFYQLLAVDDVDPDPQIFVMSSGPSGAVFGPYASGTRIKVTEAPGATPREQKIGGGPADAVDVHLILDGDAMVFAVDANGNVSDPVACLVPPPPM